MHIKPKATLLFTFILFLFLSGCTQNNQDEIPAQEESILTSLDNDTDLQVLVSNFGDNSKGEANTEKEPSILQEVDWSRVRKLTQPKLDRTAYAAAVWKTDEKGLRYLENLILVERAGKQYSYIIRYSPIKNWLENHTLSRDMRQFKGKIELYDLDYNKIAKIEPEQESFNKRSSTHCETILTVEFTELCGYGICHINGIEWTETEYCYTDNGPGGGESGWNGDDYEGDSLEPSEGGDPGFPFVEPENYVFKYPIGSNYEQLYPKLTNYLKNGISEIKNVPIVMNALRNYSCLSSSEIESAVLWGQGPEINIVDIRSTFNREAYGLWHPSHPNKIFLDIDMIIEFENQTNPKMSDGLQFFIGVVTLHELVHFGIKQNGCNNSDWEEGELFENAAYGELITRENAILRYTKGG